ncbi:MAG TPA: TIGR02587 family membrane protein [Acidimicrobiales bacterium]|nr:TIGR02587 family membrane protein [Acidimicrobiales bacterium]
MSDAGTHPVRAELTDVVRGVCGGMLFGIPLLYTMEVWWVGGSTTPTAMLAVLAVTFAIVLLLNRTSGFRSTRDVRLSDALKDSLEALAIGILCVLAVLVIIREITSDTPRREALGKVAYEGAPFVIGVGMASHFLRKGRTEGDDGESAINATLADVGATLLGALFVALNIAPTDEVRLILAAMSPAWVVAAALTSLVLSYAIVFEAGFSKQDRRRAQPGMMQHPVTETFACYLLALLASAAMLWFFQRWTFGDPFDLVLQQTVVLGLPATIGGAAGRLAV